MQSRNFRGCVAVLLAIAAAGPLVTDGRAQEPPSAATPTQDAATDAAAAPPPASSPPAPPLEGSPPPAAVARESAADGTTSVVVPAQPAAMPTPRADTAPAAGLTAPPPPAVSPPVTKPADGGAPVPLATDLLAEILQPQPATADPALYARPLTLVEALERSGDRTRRLWIVQAYWKVATAHAAVRCNRDSLERLELVAPGGDPHDRVALDVASAAARADLARVRAELGTAQQELVDLVRLPVGEPLPWPVDRPLATPYQTHFDAIFANRIATGRVRAIARALPLRHDAVEARAAAVRAAERALELAEADHARSQRPIEAVLAAHAALAVQRTEFLGAVRAYNVDIGEYAMAVADLSVPDDRFVSMLIGTPIQWRPQPASAVPPASGSSPDPAAGSAPAAAPPQPSEPATAEPRRGG